MPLADDDVPITPVIAPEQIDAHHARVHPVVESFFGFNSGSKTGIAAIGLEASRDADAGKLAARRASSRCLTGAGYSMAASALSSTAW